MNSGVGRARVGQWYTRWDKGEIFQVSRYDRSSQTIVVQTFDDDVYEIDAAAWRLLPLGFAEPPADWTVVHDVQRDGFGNSETDAGAAEWAEPLQP